MSGFIEQLLAEAEAELLEKEANDQQGAPDTVSKQEQGGGDILTAAQSFLQKIEQFKVALGDGAASQTGEEQVNPEAQAQNPEAQQTVGAAPTGNNSVVIQRPDGTILKVAELQKIASLRRGSTFVKEV